MNRTKIKKDDRDFLVGAILRKPTKSQLSFGCDVDYELFVNGSYIANVYLVQNHNGWGNSIVLDDWEKQEYHAFGVVSKNEFIYLASKMSSGNVSLIKCTYKKGDGVPDQSFLTGSLLGYVEVQNG